MRLSIAISVLAACGLVLAAVAFSTGPAKIGLPGLLDGIDTREYQILVQLRLPRILLAAVAGIGLGISGALMQTLFRNPLAEPYVTGVSAGGALGAVGATVLGFGSGLALGAGAILGGAAITGALYLMLVHRRNHPTTVILLTGLALGTFCGALVWVLLLHLGPAGTDQALNWLLGSVATVGYRELAWLAPGVAVLGALALWFHREQDVFLTGDEKAASLGVNITTARQLILGLASLLAVITVAFCGVIAFVGLIAPHIARRFVGALNRRLLPVSALCGAVILLAADLASRTIAPPSEIPLTIITSLIGAPFFIYILVRTPEVAV